MEPEDEHRIASMEARLEEVERETQEMKARAMANFALLRCLVGVLPTNQLAGLEQTFAKVAEQLVVEFMYGSWSETTNEVASASYEDWLQVMRRELEARRAASPQRP